MTQKLTKTIVVSVTNDLVTDNRVHKVCSSLVKFGYSVILIGRKLPNSLPMNQRSYKTIRMRLFFKKGICFYAEYNIRLFFLLLFTKADVLLANDLDSLPANFVAGRIKNKPLVFDSHEYFTEVPELIHRPRVQKVWKNIEQFIVPKIKNAYTVCDSIADLFKQEYGTDFKVVRNVPLARNEITIPDDKKIKDTRKIILYQGALNIGRGLPQLLDTMQYVEGALLLIAGDGDIAEELKSQAAKLKLNDKVRFLGKLPLEEVNLITKQAHLGLSIEEDMGLNYRFALPNKLFDYIQAGVPVMVSNLPEMAKIVSQHKLGTILQSHDPKTMATTITEALTNSDVRKVWKENLQKAANEFIWEKEELILKEIFDNLQN